MGIVSFLRTPVFGGKVKFPAHVIGNGETRIKIKKELLSPFGREVAGVLRLGGKSIYLTKYAPISIGSGRNCDMRIADGENTNKIHFILTLLSEGKISIANFPQGKIGVKEKSGEIKEVMVDMEAMEGIPMEKAEAIYLPIGGRSAAGTGKYLEIEIELDKVRPLAEDLRAAFAHENKPKVQMAVPQIAKEAGGLKESLVAGKLLEPELVAGTVFDKAITVDDLLSLYFSEKNKQVLGIRKKEIQGIIGTSFSFLASLPAILLPGPEIITMAIPFAVIGFGLAAHLSRLAFADKHLKEFSRLFAKSLSQAEENEIAQVLSSRSVVERDEVLSLLKEENNVKAAKIKKALTAKRKGKTATALADQKQKEIKQITENVSEAGQDNTLDQAKAAQAQKA